MVIPAQRRGAAPAGSRLAGTRQDKTFVHDHAIGVASIGDTSEVLVRGIEGEGHVRAELLKAGLALGAGAVRVNQAADRGEVAGFELGDCRADLGDAADDLVAGDDGVDGGHEAGKLVTDSVEIGVADTAEQDFDLHVVFGGITPCDRVGGKRRGRTGSGVSFGFILGFILLDGDQLVLIIAHMQGLHIFKLVQPTPGLDAFHQIAALLSRQRIHQIHRSLVRCQNVR